MLSKLDFPFPVFATTASRIAIVRMNRFNWNYVKDFIKLVMWVCLLCYTYCRDRYDRSDEGPYVSRSLEPASENASVLVLSNEKNRKSFFCNACLMLTARLDRKLARRKSWQSVAWDRLWRWETRIQRSSIEFCNSFQIRKLKRRVCTSDDLLSTSKKKRPWKRSGKWPLLLNRHPKNEINFNEGWLYNSLQFVLRYSITSFKKKNFLSKTVMSIMCPIKRHKHKCFPMVVLSPLMLSKPKKTIKVRNRATILMPLQIMDTSSTVGSGTYSWRSMRTLIVDKWVHLQIVSYSVDDSTEQPSRFQSDKLEN